MTDFTKEKLREAKRKLKGINDPVEIRKCLMDLLNLTRFIEKRKTLKVGSIPINCEIYESDKNDPVIIFLPGIGTYSEMYCEFLYKLSQWGYNVVGVDLRGHGYSGGERGEYTVELVTKDLYEVVTVLSERYNGTIAFFGCSIGAPLAMACAENDTRIKALLCHTLFLSEYPPDLLTFTGWNMLRYTNSFIPGFRINFKTYIDMDALMRGSVFIDFIDYDELIVWEYSIHTLTNIYSRKTKLTDEKMAFKAAIITGENDEVLSSAYMQSIIDKLEHDFEFIEIPGAYHMLPFVNIKETVMATRDWFRENLP